MSYCPACLSFRPGSAAPDDAEIPSPKPIGSSIAATYSHTDGSVVPAA
ncbi:hypothetical protein [Kibdelosporangium philippinense]